MASPLFGSNPILMWAEEWLDQRFAIRSLVKFAGKKEVPVHSHSIWYYMGGLAMLFVGVQIITGLLLMVYYVPTYEGAYESVRKLVYEVEFGWLIRSLHSWGANLFILVLFWHMFSAYFMKAYRAPREFTWFTGLGLLGLAMAFGFTGYLLPMDDIAYFATKVGVDVASKAPVLGDIVAFMLRGGSDIGQATMNRFFTIHVIGLPAALGGLLGLHLLLIQMHGISEPPSVLAKPIEERKFEKFFPDFILKDILTWGIAANVLLMICCFSPWPLGPAADAAAPAPIGIKPEWYFLSQFQVLKEFPAHVFCFLEGEHAAMALIGAVVSTLVIVPLIDTGRFKAISRLSTIWGWILLLLIIVLTVTAMYNTTLILPLMEQTIGRCPL
jgi:quinol-cytochrome oxidoreductase complex cytochrome b subunit